MHFPALMFLFIILGHSRTRRAFAFRIIFSHFSGIVHLGECPFTSVMNFTKELLFHVCLHASLSHFPPIPPQVLTLHQELLLSHPFESQKHELNHHS